MKPLAIMMVGLPCSGKSTLLKTYFPHINVVSSDDHLMKIAKMNDLTYSQAFPDYYGMANLMFRAELAKAVVGKSSFAVDRTNLTRKSRGEILRKISRERFTTIAIVCDLPAPEILTPLLEQREREGKIIPVQAYEMMRKRYEPPTFDEGFDLIEEKSSFLKVDNPA